MAQDDFYATFRRMHPEPYFQFPAIPSTPTVSFEKLDLENFGQLPLLFADDQSPFVDERFKNYEGAKEYATYLTLYGAFSPKQGSQDWLFKTVTGEYAGIVHLYDLSLETFAENNTRAWIGFATKEAYRNRGFTSVVVAHFIQSIFRFYPVIDYIHAMTDKENSASQRFLEKLGFRRDDGKRLGERYRFYILDRPGVNTST